MIAPRELRQMMESYGWSDLARRITAIVDEARPRPSEQVGVGAALAERYPGIMVMLREKCHSFENELRNAKLLKELSLAETVWRGTAGKLATAMEYPKLYSQWCSGELTSNALIILHTGHMLPRCRDSPE